MTHPEPMQPIAIEPEAVAVPVGGPEFTLSLPVFEGPLQLLLHLIESRQLDVLTVPLAEVADAYVEHLARHRLADLFLDTVPCNAHTTASDALWMGLPLMTCRGTTFPGRVAASLLGAIGLPELVAESLAQYDRRALELAASPQRLQ